MNTAQSEVRSQAKRTLVIGVAFNTVVFLFAARPNLFCQTLGMLGVLVVLTFGRAYYGIAARQGRTAQTLQRAYAASSRSAGLDR